MSRASYSVRHKNLSHTNLQFKFNNAPTDGVNEGDERHAHSYGSISDISPPGREVAHFQQSLISSKRFHPGLF